MKSLSKNIKSRVCMSNVWQMFIIWHWHFWLEADSCDKRHCLEGKIKCAMSKLSSLIILVFLREPQAVVYKQFSCRMCCEIANGFLLICYLGALFTFLNGEAAGHKESILEEYTIKNCFPSSLLWSSTCRNDWLNRNKCFVWDGSGLFCILMGLLNFSKGNMDKR